MNQQSESEGPQLIGDILQQGLPVSDHEAELARAELVEAKRIEHYASHLRDLLKQRREASDDDALADINDEIRVARQEVWTGPRTDYKEK